MQPLQLVNLGLVSQMFVFSVVFGNICALLCSRGREGIRVACAAQWQPQGLLNRGINPRWFSGLECPSAILVRQRPFKLTVLTKVVHFQRQNISWRMSRDKPYSDIIDINEMGTLLG